MTKTISGICSVQPTDFPALTDLWEASVRATHHFLTEQDIMQLRPCILEDYLGAVTLRAYRDAEGHFLGFVGIYEDKVEMLFVAPQARGQGIGKLLLQHAIEQFGITELDVNEQNPLAVGFYLHQGFMIVKRSSHDGMGRPFPLLHMKLLKPVLNIAE